MQYGSTGKGLFAAYLATLPQNHCQIAATNAGPNAGHTTCFKNGRKFITFHLPTFGIIQEDAVIYLNAGSIIDPDGLRRELEEFKIDTRRLAIHPRAVVVEEQDKMYEKDVNSGAAKLASTQKGVGRALARKVMREAVTAGQHPYLKQFIRPDFNLMDAMATGMRAFIEVPQGLGLSLNDGVSYPHCTGRSINVAQTLSDAGVHPHMLYKTVGVQRFFPIRVGNLVDESGVEIGNSGPVYPDQEELSWDEVGQAPEYTTVTKRKRRIFTWSDMQYAEGIRVLRPDLVFCNFLNYVPDSIGATQFVRRMETIERVRLGDNVPKMYGVGPCVEDVLPKREAYARMGWM
jgi:adenylosuccinate synthase